MPESRTGVRPASQLDEWTPSADTLAAGVDVEAAAARKPDERDAGGDGQVDREARWRGDGGDEWNAGDGRLLDDLERRAPAHAEGIGRQRQIITHHAPPDHLVDRIV